MEQIELQLVPLRVKPALQAEQAVVLLQRAQLEILVRQEG
jgi:hypothetical protein